MDIEFISQVLIIIGIDIILGGDNAIVIALASRNLPQHQRNKAIFMGTGLAIVIRIFLTIIAVQLLQVPFLQLIGGLFLIKIAYNLLVENDDHSSKIRGGTTLFHAVRTIVLADIVMGFDNVIAIAGAAEGEITLVVIGLLISIPIIIWGSKLILALMERYSFLVYFGAGILSYTAGSMIIHSKEIQPWINDHYSLAYIIPILTILFVTVLGWLSNQTKGNHAH